MDWGKRRIGLAVSDPRGVIATGLETLEVRSVEQALERVTAVAAAVEAERVVVGLPLLLDGTRGEAARAAQGFADALARRLAIPVDTYDERLTSTISERRLREVGVRRTGHRRGRIDQGAAVALLESYLHRLQAGGGQEG